MVQWKSTGEGELLLRPCGESLLVPHVMIRPAEGSLPLQHELQLERATSKHVKDRTFYQSPCCARQQIRAHNGIGRQEKNCHCRG